MGAQAIMETVKNRLPHTGDRREKGVFFMAALPQRDPAFGRYSPDTTPRPRRRRKRRLSSGFLPLLLLLGGSLFLGGFILGKATALAASVTDYAGGDGKGVVMVTKKTDEDTINRESWKLILVNRDNPLPETFEVPELKQLRSGHSFDDRAYPSLQKMLDDARAAGLNPLVCSSYRSQERQEELFDQEVQKWTAKGYSREEAEQQAAQWVAPPGTSEHQSGLAVDIVDISYQVLDEKQESTPVQQWLMAHCAEYGFILRYPTDKSGITGIGYEPWHYRFVGTKAAQEIMERGICLEEYLA